MTVLEVVDKKKTKSTLENVFEKAILKHQFCLFCCDFHEYVFMVKFYKHLNFLSMFLKEIQIFLIFFLILLLRQAYLSSGSL